MVVAKSLRTLALRSVRSLLLAAVLVLIGVAAAQDRLLYYPAPASVGEMLAATGSPGVRAWPTNDNLRGLLAEAVAPAPAATFRGTAIVFHGNAGHAGHRGYYIEALSRQGLRVILAEYPGYGARTGKLGETSLVADTVATITQVRREFGGPLYLVGESLGAGVVAAAVAQISTRGETIDGVLLITPWDTLANVAAHHYPWLPVRWLLSDRYDSVANLQAYAGPIVVVLAAADRVVPARFGQALIDALPGRAYRIVIEGADHNDWTDHVDATWWQAAMQMLNRKRP